MHAPVEEAPLVVRMPRLAQLTDDQLFELCQLNRDLRIERDGDGTVTIMAPAGWRSSARNAEITRQLATWAKRDAGGIVSDSSGGYTLPSGAMRAPDAAWVRRERLDTLAPGDTERFPHLCPDFVLELRPPSDPLQALTAKMEEYLANGAQLGWLLDPSTRTAWVYRPQRPAELLRSPEALVGDPILPGFVLDLRVVW